MPRKFLLLLHALCSVKATQLATGSSFEWAGTFATPNASYVWIAEKVGCKYADAHMKIVVLPIDATAASTEAGLKAKEADAEAAGPTCSVVESGQSITPPSDSSPTTPCYELHFDQSSRKSTFTLVPNGATHVAIFTQHVPTEFEDTMHYFQTPAGADVEPIKQLSMAGDDHAGHDHGHGGDDHGGGPAFEWAGTFSTPDPAYVWTAQKVDGDYADPGMKIVLLPATTGTDSTALHSYESAAAHAFNRTCIAIVSGQTLTPTTASCYQLNFDCALHTSAYPIDTTGVTNIAIFAEHFPIEFERDMHYLKDPVGDDVEPIAEIPEAEVPPKDPMPWGTAIGAAIIVNICTLLGVVLMVPAIASKFATNPNMFFSVGNAFAAGAILACTFFLLLFEATHLVPTPGEKEAATTGKWGAAILTGFLSPIVIELIVSTIMGGAGRKGPAETTATAVTVKETRTVTDTSASFDSVESASAPPSPPPSPPEVTAPSKTNNQVRVLCGILLGDFMHNFVDGIFIGAAFSQCGDTKGWTVTAATVYHELAQEISDYIVLTDPEQGRLKPLLALALNFISGFSVILGVIVILATDVDNYSQGMLLAYGGGVYVHIGAAECMAQVYIWANSINLRLAALFAFCIGCVGIGLVLLDHEHCFPPVAEGEADPHAGHNHGRMLSMLVGF